MTKPLDSSEKKKEETEIIIHQEGTNAYFANFFTLEVSEDDANIGFGQSLPKGEKKVREIRRRIAVTHKGLRVVAKLLAEAVANLDKKTNQN